MQEIFLHIGHGKTGSSYIQSFLALNKKKLLQIGIDYPNHKSFKKAKKNKVTSGNGRTLFKKYLKKNSNIVGSRNLLFSSELMFYRINNDNLFIDFIKKYSDKLTVIVFVRNIFSYEFTAWNQILKTQQTYLDIDKFLLHKCEHDKFDIFPTLLKWIDLSKIYGFKLKVRNYSKHKDNLLNTFLEDLIGSNEKSINFELPKINNINRSLTFLECEFQRVINYSGIEGSSLGELLIDQLPEIEPTKLRCNIETYKKVKEKNIEFLNKINSLIDKNEALTIENPEEVVYKDGDKHYKFLSIAQIEIISSYLKSNINRKESMLNKIFRNFNYK